MRTPYAFLMVTVDGYDESADQAFDWHNADNPEFAEFSRRQLVDADTLLMGRVTYEGMRSFWTTPEAAEADPVTTAQMNDIPKVVVSRDVAVDTGWGDSTLLTGD